MSKRFGIEFVLFQIPVDQDSTRLPGSALLPTFLGEGSPTKIDYRKRVPLF